MTVAFKPTEKLTRGDVDLFLTDPSGNPTNAAEISYSLCFIDPGPPEAEVLIGSPTREPVNPSVGEYYASLIIPTEASVGTYRIKWTIRRTLLDPQVQIVQEFAVVKDSVTIVSPYSDSEREMIRCLRIMLRDNNPDRNYRFMPPEHEADINAYNRVFGYVWEDEELKQYLDRAIDWWDMFPPSTSVCTINTLYTRYPSWRTSMYYGAMMFALMALSINWVHNEFSYSIGGVSLDIEKSSKYESLKGNAESQFDKATEAKSRTVKYAMGLKQSRFGIGANIALGPSLGRNALSPRSFR